MPLSGSHFNDTCRQGCLQMTPAEVSRPSLPWTYKGHPLPCQTPAPSNKGWREGQKSAPSLKDSKERKQTYKPYGREHWLSYLDNTPPNLTRSSCAVVAWRNSNKDPTLGMHPSGGGAPKGIRCI